jgi:hypothetical protein
MAENRVSAVMQTASHVLVVGAGLVYVCGFIIVSVFDSTYGIVDFALFRTEIAATGTLFLFVLMFPVVFVLRLLSQ